MASVSCIISPRAAEVRGNHISNTVPPIWFEEARVPLYPEIERATSPVARLGVVRRAIYDYQRELFHGGDVEIRTSVKSIGNSSAVFFQEAWQFDKLAMTAETVIVMIDGSTNQKLAISEQGRELLAALKL